MYRALSLVVSSLLCAATLSQAALAQKDEPMRKKGYDFRVVRLGNTFQAVRFNISTGEAWTITGNRFEKIPETGPVPPGEFDVTLVTDDNNWMAFRIERNTGTIWQMRANRWMRVMEPEENAQ